MQPHDGPLLSRTSPARFDALVLAGSYGWGKPRVPGLPPRPLARVALRPLITFTLDWLQRRGATDITVCAQGSSAALQSCLGVQYASATLNYVQELMPRGPAGCLRDAAAPASGNPLVVAEGTRLPTLDLHALLDAHRDSGAVMTVVATPGRRGGLLCPTGVYILDRRVLEFIPRHGFQDIKEALIPRLHGAGERIAVYCELDPGPHVGNVETYLFANHWAVRDLARAAHASEAHGDRGVVCAHPTSTVSADAVIVGDVVVGAGARIDAEATVVGPAVIAAHATIARGALVARSVIGQGCRVDSDAFVQSAVVADGVAVESGVRVCHSVHLQSPTRASWWSRLVRARPAPPVQRPIGSTNRQPASWFTTPTSIPTPK